MWPNDFYFRFRESAQSKQRYSAETVSDWRGKKGKKRRNWENQNTIWQEKRRFR